MKKLLSLILILALGKSNFLISAITPEIEHELDIIHKNITKLDNNMQKLIKSLNELTTYYNAHVDQIKQMNNKLQSLTINYDSDPE